MGKPSIFSHDYKERVKKRRINTFLFVLLILCIAFFGGKYYIDRHDTSAINNFKNSKIVHRLSNLGLWSKIKEKFTKAETPVVKPSPPKVIVPVTPVVPNVTKSGVDVKREIFEYSYIARDGKRFLIQYEKRDSKVIITGLKSEIKSDYDISKEKDSIVFDIKNESSIIVCDSQGKFKVISRSFYKTSKTRKIITKETVMAGYKNYIWAEKPHFTLDGRITYISRLPYIRADNTLYLWTVKIDGTNHKKIFKLNNNIMKISYGGFDNTDRLIIKVDNAPYYLAKGSYTLKK